MNDTNGQLAAGEEGRGIVQHLFGEHLGSARQGPGHLWVGLGLVLGFAALSIAIRSGLLAEVDHRLLLAFRVPGVPATPLGPPWLAESVRDITGLGSNAVMIFILITATSVMALACAWQSLWTMIAATLSSEILCSVLKAIAQRSRPGLIADVPRVFTTSFPSSHAMVSAATLFTLAALVARLPSPPGIGRLAFALAGFATFVIGVSRLYLGVHWPSDVAAGWIAGLFCAWCCCVGVSWRRRPPAGRPSG